MANPAERRALVQRHVDNGRVVIERQRRLVAKVQAQGHDAGAFESVLAAFEHGQVMFESH